MYPHEVDEAVIHYVGRPIKFGDAKEVSKWKKFTKWFSPWFKDKVSKGDDYLQAQIEKERSEALVKQAEAYKIRAEADKIKAETRQTDMRTKLELVKSCYLYQKATENNDDVDNKKPTVVPESKAEINNMLIDLQEDYDDLSMRFGFRISVSEDDDRKKPLE